MSEQRTYTDHEATPPYPRQATDTIAEDKADLAAADGKWEAFAQPGLTNHQLQELGSIATESRQQIDDEFYHAFVK